MKSAEKPTHNNLAEQLQIPQIIAEGEFLEVCTNAVKGPFIPKVMIGDNGDDKTEILICNKAKLEKIERIDGVYQFLDEAKLNKFSDAKQGNAYMRPVFYISLQRERNCHICVGLIETDPNLQRKGVASAFYDCLIQSAKKHGYKIVTGVQMTDSTTEIFLKRGRYLLEEIQEERLPEFSYLLKAADDEELSHTIEFLDEADTQSYVRPERIGTSPENKMKYKKFIGPYRNWLRKLDAILVCLSSSEVPDTKIVQDLIQTLDGPNSCLPEDKRFPIEDFDPHDPTVVMRIRVVMQFLTLHESVLCEHLSAEYLKDDIEILEEILQRAHEKYPEE